MCALVYKAIHELVLQYFVGSVMQSKVVPRRRHRHSFVNMAPAHTGTCCRQTDAMKHLAGERS